MGIFHVAIGLNWLMNILASSLISKLRTCRQALGCWLVGFLLFGFVFWVSLRVCRLRGFWMLVFRPLFSTNFDSQSGCNHFGILRTIIAASGTRGSQVGSRLDILASQIDFYWFGLEFVIPFWELVRHFGAESVSLFYACVQVCFWMTESGCLKDNKLV